MQIKVVPVEGSDKLIANMRKHGKIKEILPQKDILK